MDGLVVGTNAVDWTIMQHVKSYTNSDVVLIISV